MIDVEDSTAVAKRGGRIAQNPGDFREPGGLPQAPHGLIEMFRLHPLRGAYMCGDTCVGFSLQQLLKVREQVLQRRRGRRGGHLY